STAPAPFFGVVADFHGSPNQVWINEVYVDLLGRVADPAGLQYWSDQIEMLNVPHADVVQGILNSDEDRQKVGLKLYNDLLSRTPILTDLQLQVNLLRAGTTFEQLEAQFLSSPEYYLRNGRMDFRVYTSAVYQYVLGRAPSPQDVQFWVNFLQTGSRYDMA